MRKLSVFFLVIAVLFSFAAGVMAQEEAAEKPKIADKVGDTVPPWQGKTVGSAEVISHEGMAGSPYTLVFVNSSCAACRAELEELGRMKFGENLKVVIVSVDFNPQKTLKTYTDRLQLTYPVVDDSSFKLASLFKFNFTPATVIVGEDGKITHRFVGYNPGDKQEFVDVFQNYTQ